MALGWEICETTDEEVSQEEWGSKKEKDFYANMIRSGWDCLNLFLVPSNPFKFFHTLQSHL